MASSAVPPFFADVGFGALRETTLISCRRGRVNGLKRRSGSLLKCCGCFGVGGFVTGATCCPLVDGAMEERNAHGVPIRGLSFRGEISVLLGCKLWSEAKMLAARRIAALGAKHARESPVASPRPAARHLSKRVVYRAAGVLPWRTGVSQRKGISVLLFKGCREDLSPILAVSSYTCPTNLPSAPCPVVTQGQCPRLQSAWSLAALPRCARGWKPVLWRAYRASSCDLVRILHFARSLAPSLTSSSTTSRTCPAFSMR